MTPDHADSHCPLVHVASPIGLDGRRDGLHTAMEVYFFSSLSKLLAWVMPFNPTWGGVICCGPVVLWSCEGELCPLSRPSGTPRSANVITYD